MRLGLFIDNAFEPQPSGVGKHVRGLVEALIDANTGHELFFYTSYSRRVLEENSPFSSAVSDVVVSRSRSVPGPHGWTSERPSLWWDNLLPMLLLRDRIDVFHGPGHRVPVVRPLFRRWRSVVTIHDLAFTKMNVHGSGFDRYLESTTIASMRASQRVIAVSKSTANDCVEALGAEYDRVEVVYQGFESGEGGVELQRPQCLGLLDRPFAISVGSLQPRKNIPLLIDAFSTVADRCELDLVLAGGGGGDEADVRSKVETHGLTDRVHFTGYVSDAERAWLFRHANFLVYPSRYEGFGLVLLEAMSRNLPVITTAVSSIPEVVGDAAISVDPDDTEGLGRAIASLAESQALRQSLINAGRNRVKQFSWETCAKDTLKVYERTYGP